MSADPASYVGRFAPSPTGPLHFGSLLAAIASYLQARTNDGRWLIRVEDIDPPREPPGADKQILDALEAFGFRWDGPVRYQSEFTARHEEVLRSLLADGKAYSCSCSRRMLGNTPRGPLGIIYPGTCRNGSYGSEFAYRLKTDNEPITFTDRLQGPVTQRLESESGDFVIKRRDGLIAYHLAVVVDDADQHISEIVRGIDLLDTTPRHIFLQRQLGFPTPAYMHIPVAVNKEGQKLSKLTGATAIDTKRASEVLALGLAALGQALPDGHRDAQLDELWDWAFTHWDIGPLAGVKSIPDEQFLLAGS